MKIEGSVALVTGANRGLGAEFARQLLDRGAAKVYGAVRDPGLLRDDRVVPVRLDVTDQGSIEAAAKTATDVTLLVNNAGIMTDAKVLGDEERLRREIEVNYLGTAAVTRAFAPILAANGGGAVLNVLSVLSWVTLPTSGGYSAAKAASWAATNALRHELHKNATRVLALHVGYMDTDMTKDIEAPKSRAERGRGQSARRPRGRRARSPGRRHVAERKGRAGTAAKRPLSHRGVSLTVQR